MRHLTPASADDLAQALREAASHSKSIAVSGNGSKRLMGGPTPSADIDVSTAGLRRVLHYEPNDLTISVEAGLPFLELQRMLAERKQMIALDPPFAALATVGGVLASNCSGPLRCRFGTARDLVLGMTFATPDGRLIQTGGMVVKNVAGLDIGKLMIGSFGTLATLVSVNFRVHSMPTATRTFVFTFSDLDAALEKRKSIFRSVLEPIAMDLLSPVAAARFGYRGFLLSVQAGGSEAVLDRYTHELSGSDQLTALEETRFWQQVREFTPEFLARQPSGVVLRISTPVGQLRSLLRLISGPSLTRATSGVTFVYLSSWQGVSVLWRAAAEHGWSAVVEFAPEEIRSTNELWLMSESQSNGSFSMMKRVKHMFDPENLLNRGRLYGRI